jgi:hypothetical protein
MTIYPAAWLLFFQKKKKKKKTVSLMVAYIAATCSGIPAKNTEVYCL